MRTDMSISKQGNRITAIMLTAVMLFSLFCFDAQAASNEITLKSYTAPTTHRMGKIFIVKGKIKAGKKISKVTVGVVNKKTGKWTKVKYSASVNRRSYNLKKADPKLKFGKLKAGDYYYRIFVKLKGQKAQKILNTPFEVVDNNAETVKIDSSTEESVSFKNCKAPGTYKVGNEFSPTGTVSCTSKIKKVEVGIVFEPTNKWTSYKYTAKVNAKSFALSKAASKLKFNKLPGGDFRYRMYVHTADGAKLAFDMPFTVTPSSRPKKAVKWAKKIANDDSFTYGKSPIANQQGCYFCGNNTKKVSQAKKAKMKNPERYEKTYVCLTFIGAAYAHGAGDPEILSECKKRRMTMYETNDNFKVFSCWMKLGSCKELTVDDLQPGDVIIKWSDHNDNHGHVCMYIGGNDLVEAAGASWSKNSIGIKKNAAAKRLKSLSSNSKNYVMRYIK